MTIYYRQDATNIFSIKSDKEDVDIDFMVAIVQENGDTELITPIKLPAGAHIQIVELTEDEPVSEDGEEVSEEAGQAFLKMIEGAEDPLKIAKEVLGEE